MHLGKSACPIWQQIGVVARAIGAVDQALWDIKGKCLGQPIYRLLGGSSPDSVAAYTTFGFNVYSKKGTGRPGSRDGTKRTWAAEIPVCSGRPRAGCNCGRDLILAGAVDVMHANVLDGGGYTTCLKVAHMAEMFHLPLATGGGWYLQNGQLIAGVSNGWMTEFHLLRERIYEMIYINPPVAKNGRLPLPDKPGMGLELNQDAVAAFLDL